VRGPGPPAGLPAPSTPPPGGHGDPGALPVAAPPLPGVQPDAPAHAELRGRLPDGMSAADGSSRSVEAREEAVPRRVDLLAAEAGELVSHALVVAGEQVAPLPVAEGDGSLGRARDVGEEHPREHPGRLTLPPPHRPRLP